MPNLSHEDNVITTPINELEWDNGDNNAFYEAVKAEGLQQFAEKAGLATGCDMHELTPYWTNAQSILEVGAGYGRVIDYLLRQQFQGKITAIERCHVLFEYLNKQFGNYENVNLLQTDIRYLENYNNRFDLILIMLLCGLVLLISHGKNSPLLLKDSQSFGQLIPKLSRTRAQ